MSKALSSSIQKAALLLVVGILAACSQPELSPPYKPVGDNAHFMAHVLEPASDLIWRSAGTVITADGEEDLAPQTEEDWLAIEHSASVIAESGNLLIMPGRAMDRADWVEISLGLTRVGEQLFTAAEAKDPDAIFELGGQLYNVCTSCHQLYWKDAPVNP